MLSGAVSDGCHESSRKTHDWIFHKEVALLKWKMRSFFLLTRQEGKDELGGIRMNG